MKRFLVLLCALAGCSEGPTERVVSEDMPELAADRVVYRAAFNITSDGVRRALQRSDSMYMYEDSSVAQLFGVNLIMYDSIGRQTADVRSLRGRMNSLTQEMTALGSVVVVLANGMRIESEELNYDPQSRRIWSDVETRQTAADGCVTNFGTFRTDEQFSFFEGTNMRGCARGLTF